MYISVLKALDFTFLKKSECGDGESQGQEFAGILCL